MALSAEERSAASSAGAQRRIWVPDIAWVEIPAGEFIYGEGSEQRRERLGRFWVAKYPITNAQFQCFIDDGGYTEERWWLDLKRPEPEEPVWPQPNRPRTNVDWYEAVAFCRWLSARLGLPEVVIRLPTEREWERAARGREGRTYPWGEDFRSGHANVDETETKAGPWYLEQTTAVGLYPHGGSPEGVQDLAGTVWEWCQNKFDEPDVTDADTSDAWPALRGGSWVSSPDYARADFLGGDLPDLRFNDRGFRVLCAVPLVPTRRVGMQPGRAAPRPSTRQPS